MDLFNINVFESKTTDDLLGSVINESSEKPYNLSIAVPGGDSETPNAKPYDSSSISIPGKTTITSDQYNSALANLKKSFKEAAEVVEALENANVVPKTPEELQMEFTELCVENALLESFENGPMFEKVEREDKDEVKEIVQKVRKTIKKKLEEENVHFYEPRIILRAITSVIPWVGTLNVPATLQQVWTNRLWQVIGVMHVDEGNVKEVISKLNNTFKSDLGDYKIIESESHPAMYDLFKTKLNWKNRDSAYFLVVDKKLPSDLKAAQKEIVDAIKANKK